MLKRVPLLLLLLVLGGCQTWQRVSDSTARIDSDKYHVVLPVGWVLFRQGDMLLVSKDGPDLQRIQVDFEPHEKAFEQTKKHSSPEMLPDELARLYIAEFRKQFENGLPTLEIVENRPYSVDGVNGFQVAFTYVADTGLKYKVNVTGFATDDGFYSIIYKAPLLHYYGLDEAIYYDLLQGFQLKRT